MKQALNPPQKPNLSKQKAQSSLAIVVGILILMVWFSVPVFAQKNYQPTEVKELKSKDAYDFHEAFFNAISERHKGNTDKAEEELKKCLKLAKDRSSVYTEFALLYFYRAEYALATENALTAYNLDKTNESHLVLLIQINEHIRDYLAIIEQIEDFLEVNPNHEKEIEYNLKIANSYERMNDFEKALSVYQNLEKRYGVHPKYTGNQHQLLILLNEFDDAIELNKRLVQAFPNQNEFKFQLASVYEKVKNNHAAKEVYLNILKANEKDGLANLRLAHLLVEEQRIEEAMNHFKIAFEQNSTGIGEKTKTINQLQTKAIDTKYLVQLAKILELEHPYDADVLSSASDIYIKAERSEDAIESIRKSLDINVNQFQLWQNLVELQLKLEKYKDLESSSAQAIEVYPSQTIFYLVNGMAKNNLEKYSEAIEVLEMGKVYQFGNDEIKIQFNLQLANAYFNSKQEEKAYEYFETNLGINPKNVATLNNYVYALARKKYKLDKAAKMATYALELDGANANTIDTYAWVLFAKGDYKKSLEELLKAKQMNPNSAEITEHLGDVYFHLKEKENAIKYWKEAKSLGRNNSLLEKKINTQKYYEE